MRSCSTDRHRSVGLMTQALKIAATAYAGCHNLTSAIKSKVNLIEPTNDYDVTITYIGGSFDSTALTD